MKRRENIQKRGYDSSVSMAAKNLKKQQAEQPNNQEPHELQHMHPDMEEYQKALPPPKEDAEGEEETEENAEGEKESADKICTQHHHI